jgi:hypothetical protein
MSNKKDLIVGITSIIAGLALFLWSGIMFLSGVVWPWGLAGGIAFACIGAMRIFYYFDDKQGL